MSENILVDNLPFSEMAMFSCQTLSNPISGTWKIYGHERLSPLQISQYGGAWLRSSRESLIFEFGSKCSPMLFEKFFPKSSQEFKNKNLKIISCISEFKGAEYEMVELILDLPTNRYHDIGMLTPIIRQSKLKNLGL